LEYYPECDRPVFRLGVLFEDLSALNKSQVGVELLLKDRLVPNTIGPVQVVAYREDDVASLSVDTQNVYHLSLFDRHWPFLPPGNQMPVPVRPDGPRRAPESGILFSFETDFTGRVKAGPQIETWQGRSAAAFTPAVILFIALPEAEDNIEPG
jgi:hypothetical protein